MFVSELEVDTHNVFPGKLHITKPTSEELSEAEEMLDGGYFVMPGRTFLRLWFDDGKWVVQCRESVLLIEPGDFINYFDTEEEAAEDVIKFFSGDERWQAKQLFYKQQKEQKESDAGPPPTTVP